MQKLAVRLGGQSVRPLLDAMNPGDWKLDIASLPCGEIGVLYAPGQQSVALTNAGIGPGLQRLENGDVIAWSGLPLAPNRKLWVPRASDLPDVAPRLDGTFAAIGWSAATQQLYVVTDFLGLQPIYVGDPQGHWTAATETKAFPYTPDPAGWGGFISCGHAIGRGSMTLHAERPRPATILTVTPGAPGSGSPAKVETTRYWQFPTQGTKEPSAEEAVDALLENAAAYQAVAEENVCLLSGGFDSRLILGLLYRMQVEQRRALILSHDDEDADLDGRLARMVARRTGTPVSTYQPDRDYFSSADYLDYVWGIDGATPNLYLFIAQLSGGLSNTGAIWEGLIPAMAFKSIQRTEEGSFAAFRQQKCKPVPEVIQIFKPWARQMFLDAFDAEFERTRSFYPDSPHGMWQWVIDNRMRHRIGVNPTKVYANYATPLMLGASRRLWDITAPAPYDQRHSRSLYLDVFRTLAPELARVPFYSGGVLHRADSPAMLFAACYYGQRMWKAIARNQRIARRLGVAKHYGFAPSSFVRHPALYQEDDDMLDVDVVRRAETDEALRKHVGKQLFHWRTTRWVHENRLHETLLGDRNASRLAA